MYVHLFLLVPTLAKNGKHNNRPIVNLSVKITYKIKFKIMDIQFKRSNNIYIIILFIISFFACNEQQSQNNLVESNNRNGAADADQEYERMDEYTTSEAFAPFAAEGLEKWKQEITEIEDVRIESTADGHMQPALFYASGSEKQKPLLVVLHSWSSGYLQHNGIPYAKWAEQYDWAFIHPNYRGEYDNPEATASDLAIQDIVDAVDYAKVNSNIDESQVFLVGFSGGAMTALTIAGRHPDIWAGVVAWVPIFDLVDWYQYNTQFPGREYDAEIVASCGGAPIEGTEAFQECRHRSPIAHLENARGLPVYIAHGISDDIVLPSHSIRAFNLLAEDNDRISEQEMKYIDANNEPPADIEDEEGQTEFFGTADPIVHFVRKSNNARLVLFQGGHDMVYNPTLLWLSEQRR
jgi:predicted esterase